MTGRGFLFKKGVDIIFHLISKISLSLITNSPITNNLRWVVRMTVARLDLIYEFQTIRSSKRATVLRTKAHANRGTLTNAIYTFQSFPFQEARRYILANHMLFILFNLSPPLITNSPITNNHYPTH